MTKKVSLERGSIHASLSFVSCGILVNILLFNQNVCAEIHRNDCATVQLRGNINK